MIMMNADGDKHENHDEDVTAGDYADGISISTPIPTPPPTSPLQ